MPEDRKFAVNCKSGRSLVGLTVAARGSVGGNRRIVVDWAALHFAPADQRDRITLDLSREQIRAAPEYKAGKPVIVLTAVPEM